jgi:hypothetical protein
MMTVRKNQKKTPQQETPETTEKVIEQEVKEVEETQEKKKSILDFNQEEISQLDQQVFAKYDNNTLLKVLYVRSVANGNPSLHFAVKKALLSTNFEFEQKQRSHTFDNSFNQRGRGNFRGNFRGTTRGSFRGKPQITRGGFKQRETHEQVYEQQEE